MRSLVLACVFFSTAAVAGGATVEEYESCAGNCAQQAESCRQEQGGDCDAFYEECRKSCPQPDQAEPAPPDQAPQDQPPPEGQVPPSDQDQLPPILDQPPQIEQEQASAQPGQPEITVAEQGAAGAAADAPEAR